MDIPLSPRSPMNMAVGLGIKRPVEGAGGNDRLATTSGEVRHRAPTRRAKRDGETPGGRQIKPGNLVSSTQPSQRRRLDSHLA